MEVWKKSDYFTAAILPTSSMESKQAREWNVEFGYISNWPNTVTTAYGVRGIRIIGADGSPIYPRVPSDEIPRAAIVVGASALGVLYIRDDETGKFGFHTNVWDPRQTTPRVSIPLDMEFVPDTPLCCQPDGALSRSAKRGGPEARPDGHEMTATLLVLEVTREGNLCVLVCELMPAETRPNSCRHLGMGW